MQSKIICKNSILFLRMLLLSNFKILGVSWDYLSAIVFGT